IIALAGAYSNIGYMGPGLTLAAFGPVAAVPTALIFCIDNALLGRLPAELPTLLLLKLMLHPVFVYLLLEGIGGFDRVLVMTAMLMAALPPALNVFVIAQQYGVYVERASTTVLAGTVVSVVTVTGLLYL
ncbi:AEC family transporter, partial [Mycobacterium tuberculosis]|nr:AEC family transporter [Mycobacterium tuberculosis]